MNKFKEVVRYQTNSAKWDLFYNKIGSHDYVSFTVADSDYSVPDAIKESLGEVVERGILGYTMVGSDLKNVIKEWTSRRYNYNIDTSWIISSPGVVNSLNYCVKTFANRFNRILIQTPVYTPFYNVAKENDKELVENKLLYNEGKYHMDFAILDKQLSEVDCMIICNPHNPIGRVWTYDELLRVVDLCKKHNVILISDEIHCDIVFKDYKFTSLMNMIK